MKRKLIALLLTFSLSFLIGAPTAMAASGELGSDKTVSVALTPIDSAKEYTGAAAYMAGLANAPTTILQASSLSIVDGFVKLSIRYGAVAHDFDGNLFTLGHSSDSNNDFVVGDFQKNDVYSVAMFKVQRWKETNKSPVVNILLEDLSNGKLIDLQFSISSAHFDALYGCALKSTVSLIEASEKRGGDRRSDVYTDTLSLMMPFKRFIVSDNTEQQRSLQSNHEFESTTYYYPRVAVDYDEDLKPFFNSVKNSTSATVSSKMNDVFSQLGWKMYQTDEFFYVMHGVQNTSTERLVGITVASVSTEADTDDRELFGDFFIVHSLTLSYDTVTDTATVLMYDAGIRLEDAVAALHLTNETTNFYQMNESHHLSGSGSISDLLVAAAQDVGVPGSVFAALELAFVESTDDSGYSYLGTDSAQVIRYESLLVSVANKAASSAYLWGYGDNLGVYGRYRDGKVYSGYSFIYSFTGYSLI